MFSVLSISTRTTFFFRQNCLKRTLTSNVIKGIANKAINRETQPKKDIPPNDFFPSKEQEKQVEEGLKEIEEYNRRIKEEKKETPSQNEPGAEKNGGHSDS